MDDIISLHSGTRSKGAANATGASNSSYAPTSSAHQTVYFMRQELSQILNVYGRMVAAGKWHDYAIDHMKGQAVFSIFRRASEMPMYTLVKDPSLASKQGQWRLHGMNGQILKRGKDLKLLLRYFDRQVLKAI